MQSPGGSVAFLDGHCDLTAETQGSAMDQTTRDVANVGNVVRLPEVRRMTKLGRSTIYRLQADRKFPQSFKLGARAVGWLEREVCQWLADRVARSRDEHSK
jgi:prophage regulatory protein